MKYHNLKHGLCSVIIGTIDGSGVTNQNILMNIGIDELRKMVKNFFLEQIKKMKPDIHMIIWKTSVGEFTIFKESNLDYTFEPHKFKYKIISTKLQIQPTKGKLKTITINTKKSINRDYEGFEECPNCNEKGMINFTIKRWGETIKCCKKCKDFDIEIEKISKRLDKEKALQKKGLTQHN